VAKSCGTTDDPERKREGRMCGPLATEEAAACVGGNDVGDGGCQGRWGELHG